MSAEVVVLEEYRQALAIIASRQKMRRWIGMRFSQLECFVHFAVPPSCGGRDLIYMKLYDNTAAIWGSFSGCVWPDALGNPHATLFFSPDMPVHECRFEFVPPGC